MDKQFFVCHSSHDTDLAESLVEELEANGYKCWLAVKNAGPGPEFENTVTEAILNSAAVLLIFTENTSSSGEVRGELDVAANLKIPIITLKYRDGEVSRSITYYTEEQQHIDCIALQSSTPEIVQTLINIAKEPVVSEPQDENNRKNHWWKIALATAVAAILVVGLLARTNGLDKSVKLFNTALGPRNTWDYASDIVTLPNGNFIAAGGWDRGHWSRLWITGFDVSGRFIYSWSDSVSGECRPLLLPTADGGCMAVYADFRNADDSGFVFKTVRLNSIGMTAWANERRIDYPGGNQPELSSLCWLSDSIAVASFTTRSPSDNRHAVFLARIKISDGTGSTINVPGNIEALCMATSDSSSAFLATRNIVNSSVTLRKFSPEGIEESAATNSLQITPSSAAYSSDNSLLVAGTRNGGSATVSVFKLNEDMTVRWENNFDREIQGTVSNIAVLPSGEILITGSTIEDSEGEADGWVARLSESGKTRWIAATDTGGDDHLLAADVEPDGSLLLSGTTTCFGDRDAWFLRISSGGEFDSICVSGIDLFTENWETGFVQQTFWLAGLGGEDFPSVTADEATGNFGLEATSPVVQRTPVKLFQGLCYSMEVSLKSPLPHDDSLWVSFGTTELNHVSLFDGETDCELRLNCLPKQAVTLTSGRNPADSSIVLPVFLSTTKPVLFTIENLEDSVYFRMDDSLLFATPSLNNPDSLRLIINGSPSNTGCLLENIRIFRRAW